jgi:hypothetical protein
MVINFVAHNGWKLHQMDVKSSFLNDDLKEYILMAQPKGFEVEGQKHKFFKLVKDLYGLKQAPRDWYAKMDNYLQKVGFQQSESNDTLYFQMQDKHLVILVLYVDDLIIIGNNDVHIKWVKEKFKAGFKMIDLETLHYYLGVEVSQNPNKIFLSQTNYATELLNKFGMEDCKPSLTPMKKKFKLSKFEGGGGGGGNW